MIPAIGTRSRLYSCSQRVAFHVHTSRLLCQSSTEDLPRLLKQDVAGDVALQAVYDEETRSVVEGINDMKVASDDEVSEDSNRKRKTRGGVQGGPATCSQAISLGLSCFEREEFDQAIELFTRSLELPGNGAVRMAGSVKEYACPSEGEEQAALYNMACCYARLGEADSGLLCLKGLLESGFDDYDTLRTDKDLEGLRTSPEFEAVLGKYDNLASKLLGRKKRKTDKKKNWLARW